MDMIIPDGEILYRYAKPLADFLPTGQTEIPISLFSDGELSCDWAKYRPDPKTSFHIDEGRTTIIAITVCDAIRNPRNPKNGGSIEEAWHQTIIHEPISAEEDAIHGENYAHSVD